MWCDVTLTPHPPDPLCIFCVNFAAGNERLSSRLHVQRIPWLQRRLQLLILEPSALLTAAFLSRSFSSSRFVFLDQEGMSVSCVGVSVLCVRVCTPSVAAKEACLV